MTGDDTKGVFDLSVVIVSWNVRDLLKQCLVSLYENFPASSMEVWIVDNASKDCSVEMVREEFPMVRVVQNTQNQGFAHANNQAMEQCTGRYILLLNPDTVIKPRALQTLIAYMEQHPDTGAVGPRLLNGDGSLQVSCFPFPSLNREVWRLFHLDVLHPYGVYDKRLWRNSATQEVDSIQGACLLLYKEALDQVGLLDDAFFMYTEEIDLCFRLKRKGWKITWIANADIVHYGGQSSRQEATRSFLNLYQSKLLFFRKHYGKLTEVLYRLVLLVTALARLAISPLAWLEPASKRSLHLQVAHNYLELVRQIPSL